MNLNLRQAFYGLALSLMTFTYANTCAAGAVEWHGVSYDDQTVAKLVTVITATSPIASNPSTKCLHTAQSSLFRNPVLAQCKKIIVFDDVWPQHVGSKEHQNYIKFKQNVLELTKTDPYFTNTELVICPSWVHLCGAVAEALKHVDTPFVYMHQHDLILKKDFDLNGIVATMVANPNIKYVNLWGGINGESSWYTLHVDEVIDGIHFVPLCRSCGWTDQAHVASVEYYKDFVLPKCSYCFMEGMLNPALRESVWSLGIDEGHKPFGTYLYGDLQDGDYIFHLDGRKN